MAGCAAGCVLLPRSSIWSKVVNAVLNTRNSAELESAEVGAVGVEIGAGISIPLGGTEGSIFIDGSLEWRSGYTSMDATIGYRVNF